MMRRTMKDVCSAIFAATLSVGCAGHDAGSPCFSRRTGQSWGARPKTRRTG